MLSFLLLLLLMTVLLLLMTFLLLLMDFLLIRPYFIQSALLCPLERLMKLHWVLMELARRSLDPRRTHTFCLTPVQMIWFMQCCDMRSFSPVSLVLPLTKTYDSGTVIPWIIRRLYIRLYLIFRLGCYSLAKMICLRTPESFMVKYCLLFIFLWQPRHLYTRNTVHPHYRSNLQSLKWQMFLPWSEVS